MNTTLNLNEQLLTLRVPGDFTSTTVETFRNEVNSQLETAKGAASRWNTLQIDLGAAKMIDSAGLNLIVTWFKRLRLRGAKMRITYSSPNVLRTFIFTRLDKHIELVKV